MDRFLREGVSLEIGEAGASLWREGAGVRHQLPSSEALPLALLARFGNAEAAAAHLGHAVPVETADKAIGLAIERWSCYLGSGAPRDLPASELRALGSDANRNHRRVREAAPAAISWLVTLHCNRRCPHCYYRVRPATVGDPDAAADASFGHDDVRALLDQMSLLGTSMLFLTGGEPLLRADLVPLIAHATSLGIDVRMNTRYPIDAPFAKRLRSAGLQTISFSLDAADSRLADGLAGSPGYRDEAVRAIRCLLDEGISTDVNAVATAPGSRQLMALGALCVEIGVGRLTISPYMEPEFARASHVKLIRVGPPLPRLVDQIRDAYGDRLEVAVGSAEAAASAQRVSCDDRLLCEVGLRTLDILPDGSVTRCRYAPDDRALVVGSVVRQSLIDVWNGEALRRLTFPDPSAFAGSDCEGCGEQSRCNDRGRCIVGARARTGRLFAPDAGCTA